MAREPKEENQAEALSRFAGRPRQPYSGDDADPEGKSEKNRKLREAAEKEHKHK